MQETGYYGDGTLWVTDQRLVVGETTYWLHDIEAVWVLTLHATDRTPTRFPWGELLTGSGLALIPMLIGAALGSVGYRSILNEMRSIARPIYMVKLKLKSYNPLVLVTFDREHAAGIAKLIRMLLENADAAAITKELQSRHATPAHQSEYPDSTTKFYEDSIATVTSESVTVREERYPLYDVTYVEVRLERITDFFQPREDAYIVALYKEKRAIEIYVCLSSNYAYKLADAIKAAIPHATAPAPEQLLKQYKESRQPNQNSDSPYKTL